MNYSYIYRLFMVFLVGLFTTNAQSQCANITLSPTNVSCNGATDGCIVARFSGGASPATMVLNWSNGVTNVDSICNLAAGTYTLTVRDTISLTPLNICLDTATITITSPTAVDIVLDSIHHLNCNGAATGAIYLRDTTASNCSSATVVLNEIFVNPTHPNDGSQPNTAEFIELLGPPGMDISCYVLTDGDWTITLPTGSIIPADGIFSIGNDTVWGAGTFDLDAENCNCTTGAGLLILTNSSGEYLALFDNSGNFMQGLMYGNPTGQNIPSRGMNTTNRVINTIGTMGCLASVTIPDSNSFERGPRANVDGTSLSRNPDGTGNWVVQMGGTVNSCNFGGNSNTSYLWSNGDTTLTITGLNGGTYTITATDGTNCSTRSYTVNAPANPLTHSIVSADTVSCNGLADANLVTTTTGGTGGYNYLWSNGATTQNLSGLAAASYTVTVTDANGCTTNTVATITEPTAIVLVDNITNVTCGGNNDGSIRISPSGGTPGYTYQWNSTANNQTTATATGLASSTYSLTVTDANNCTITGNGYFVVGTIPVDSASVPMQTVQGNLTCDLVPRGHLNINTSGTYTYLWSNGATTQNVTNLPAGNYTVTISNTLGCFVVQSGSVTAPFVPSINPFINTAGASSATVNTGTSNIISGGNDQSSLGVNYQWTAPTAVNLVNTTAHNTTVTSTTVGTYPLILVATSSDSYACTDSAIVMLTVEANYIGIPNAFTPNADGLNDIFRPVGITANEVVDFKVYNRFGGLVYQGKDLNNGGWDGTLNGIAQPRGVYIYTLVYKANNVEKTRRGEITLLR